jgi:hypothetical protein
MKYTKEQAEMLALLVLMGCAIIVLSFLYLVKPNFTRLALSRKELKKTEAAIGKLSPAPVMLAKAKKEAEELTATVDAGQKSVFAGIETGSPLSELCVQAATALNLKPAYGEQSNKRLLEFSERAADGSQATKHYDEVSRSMDIRAASFFDFCRFLGAMEHANPGVRVSDLKVDSLTLDPQSQAQGKANANIEVTLLGIREQGTGDGSVVAALSPDVFDVGDKRNPFGPPGGSWESTKDPLAAVREMLKKTKVTGISGASLLIEVPAKSASGQDTVRSLSVQKGQTFALGQAKVKYVEEAGDRFVFEVTEQKVRFTIETNYRGVVTTLKEEELK